MPPERALAAVRDAGSTAPVAAGGPRAG